MDKSLNYEDIKDSVNVIFVLTGCFALVITLITFIVMLCYLALGGEGADTSNITIADSLTRLIHSNNWQRWWVYINIPCVIWSVISFLVIRKMNKKEVKDDR